ncbi:MAG: hypothetical protein DA408_11935 [Bacteroidetes bacterium]|nr:MAG: hypothetical protein C7N36_16945 [Bacteroidota bacterium]PTM12072.1 MAG: hypothetical protein DA408_11935 [Bacteroidota bacterium]
MLNLRSFFLAALLAITAWSCTDTIDLDANFKTPELVVDAWLTQEPTTQTVLISLTQDYFNATAQPAVTDATVLLSNETQGKTMPFVHQGNGAYSWTPPAGATIGGVGDQFVLTVTYKDRTYLAQSALNPVPPVDSIVYEVREAELTNPAGIYAQVYARDLVGTGNTYWIKTYKNGVFLNKPAEINLCADGVFSLDTGSDGIVFIPPIRETINRIPDPDTADNSDVPPYAVGDSIRVEIHAITNEAFRFLTIAQQQMTNSGLFALPVTNSPTNIVPLTAGVPAALGFFNVAAVSSKAVLVE